MPNTCKNYHLNSKFSVDKVLKKKRFERLTVLALTGRVVWNTTETQSFPFSLPCAVSSCWTFAKPTKLVMELADLGPPTSTCDWILDCLANRPQAVIQ